MIKILSLYYIYVITFLSLALKYKRWNDTNLFSIEPIRLNNHSSITGEQHTYSWIHMDVRSFEKRYLLDEYFCTDATTLNEEKLITFIHS